MIDAVNREFAMNDTQTRALYMSREGEATLTM